MATSILGPALSATLVTPDLGLSTMAWCDYLHQHVDSDGYISLRQARDWGFSKLAQAPFAWLANELGERWLRLIEVPGVELVDPFRHKGWMSLEINVQDVDALRSTLEGSPFRIIGEPANLDVSDDIRAMQVIGPAGEVLYLTEVKAEVPPFELPFARCAVDRLFIPVLLADDRDKALAVYEQFPGTEGLKFDTKITVINRARQLDADQKHPVSTIQLRGKNLIEIDQLDGLQSRPVSKAGLPAGVAMVTFATDTLPVELRQTLQGSLLTGSAGELIELIETVS